MQKKIDKNKKSETSHITNYLPHHAVFNVNKPGQVRVVYHASANYQETNTNENLDLFGLDISDNLSSVLTRFWKAKYAVTADIK